MNTIRLLNIDKDMPIITEAWNWRFTAPKWFRESLDIWKEDFDEMLAAMPNELHYGVFVDDQPTAVIRLIEERGQIFNIHLSAKRKTDFEVLLQAGSSVRDYLFDRGVKSFYGFLPTVNRGVSHLYERLGFTDTGIRIYKGTIRGKTGEFKHYSLVNPKLLLKTPI